MPLDDGTFERMTLDELLDLKWDLALQGGIHIYGVQSRKNGPLHPRMLPNDPTDTEAAIRAAQYAIVQQRLDEMHAQKLADFGSKD
jgi:hypothetical protein